VAYVNIPTGGRRATLENFIHLKQRVEAAKLKVWNIGNSNVHNMPEVTLNLPGRAQKIEDTRTIYGTSPCRHLLHDLRSHGNGIWSSARETTRGGAPTRASTWQRTDRNWVGKVFKAAHHGRKYSKESLGKLHLFHQASGAVAEEIGMRIGIHPDDPPVPELGGVPRCIFGNFDGYTRALEIANSPNIGVCLCAGTWMEGGKQMGKDVFEAPCLRQNGQLWRFTFAMSAGRSVLRGTFVDNGYTDMCKLMKTLYEVDFRGAVIATTCRAWSAAPNRLGLQHWLHQGPARGRRC